MLPGATNKETPSIDELYPQFTEAQRAEAEYYLGRYLEIVRDIFERNQNLTA